jgi:RNA polymerase sigma factor FliA
MNLKLQCVELSSAVEQKRAISKDANATILKLSFLTQPSIAKQTQLKKGICIESEGQWAPLDERDRLLKERQELIKKNLKLVHQIANKLNYVKTPEMDYDDLLAYGIIGLIEAAEKFNPAKGFTFASFASLRIKGAILDQLRVSDRLSRGSRKKVKALSASIEELESELGGIPNDRQIAKRMNLSLDELYEIQKDASMITLSLNTALSNDNEESWLDQISDEQPTPHEDCELKNFHENLVKAIDELPERERLVIGLYHYQNYTMKQIAKTIKVSESRTCQIHNRAISILKTKLEQFIEA